MLKLPPERVLALLVAGLLVLMGAGLLTMYRVGPPRGQLYALLHQPQRHR
jgi:hypothetical protein